MRIPKKLQVSGYTLTIKHEKGLVVNGVECLGTYDPNTKTIYLKKGMSPVRKVEVFIHEYIHFLEDIYCIKNSEENVNCLASGMIQLLLNPRVKIKEIESK